MTVITVAVVMYFICGSMVLRNKYSESFTEEVIKLSADSYAKLSTEEIPINNEVEYKSLEDLVLKDEHQSRQIRLIDIDEEKD